MAVNRTPQRRRQRSVRVTVAVALLALATAVVVAALAVRSTVVLSIALVAVLVLGWAALRIMWTEITESRREHAADRAAAAHAYKSLFSRRAAEHAEFTSAMTERLATSHKTLHEMEGVAVAAERRAAQLELESEKDAARIEELAAQVGVEQQRADENALRVSELEGRIQTLAAESESRGADLSDLMEFEDKVTTANTADAEIRKPA